MEIFKAHRQWAQRPEDQRFESLQALYNVTKAYAKVSREAVVPWDKLRTEAHKEDVLIVGQRNTSAQLSHFGFGQLCGKVEAPAEYLRGLPATLAVQNLNHGLKKRADEFKGSNAQLLFHQNGGLLMRAITTEKYSRVWNHEVIERVLPWQAIGWEPARPDIRQSMGDFPALYASDHDMFAFLRNKSVVIREPGNPDGLQRGIIIGNSEVGTSSIWIMWFLYREMCGNHIIWGASQVKEIRFKHVGDVRNRFAVHEAVLKEYANSSVSDEEAKIKSLKRTKLGLTKEEVLDRLFGKRTGVSRKMLEASYDTVVPEQDGDPNTVWGMVQGMTRYSQTIPYADQRTKIDKAAGDMLNWF
jgi:hypothetical protein